MLRPRILDHQAAVIQHLLLQGKQHALHGGSLVPRDLSEHRGQVRRDALELGDADALDHADDALLLSRRSPTHPLQPRLLLLLTLALHRL
jgi:hypothetical protein